MDRPVRQEQEESGRQVFPDPEKVLYRSLILPGWGQVTNRQIWKVPVIYGIFAGVIYYNRHLTTRYHGYRAAYYNVTRGDESDFRFGPTPDFVPPDWTAQQLKTTRDNLRNQRDFSYILIFLAYGLNALDAYVFAHMRSFDVSDDLSATTRISPGILETGTPGIRLSIGLNSRPDR